MAYGKKYIFSAISKSGLTYTAEIWENDYVGTSYNVNTGADPFVLDCLASGDDPFQPVLPTTLTIQADFTDFAGPLPDFLTTDSKKYYVKLYANGTTYFIWQGFVLMDTLSIPFTTGRNFVNIICVDGLGILKSAPYGFTSANINVAESLVQIIRNCLAAIGTPETFYINSAVNYYAQFQNTAQSYLRQTYILPSVWMNADYTFKSCYDVLETICQSHGVQIYQSNGEWWVTSVNERASDTLRVFRTDNLLTADTVSTVNINRTIRPYQSDALTPFFFIENTQNKTISKGYQYIELAGPIDYPDNSVMNGNMAIITSGVPDFFTRTIGTSGTFVMNSNSGINGATMIAGTTQTDLQANSCGDVGAGDILEIKYQIKAAVTGVMKVEIKVDTGSLVYYYQKSGSNSIWSTTASFYDDDINGTSLESRTITTIPCPVNGFLTLRFRVQSSGSINEAFIANIKKTAKPSIAEQRTLYNQTSTNQYKKELTTKIGLPFPADSSVQVQTLLNLDIGGAPLGNFQRFGGTETYANLGNLLYSQLYNILSIPQVNISFTAYNLFNQSGNYIVGLLHNFGVVDPTSFASINAARFIMGSCSINFTKNVISGTALQVSNAILTYTLIDNPATSPTPICKQYTNNTGANWIGSYIRCDGVAFGPVTLTPGQSVCARIYTPITISGSNLTMGINCV
jgi:hypothetical protein